MAQATGDDRPFIIRPFAFPSFFPGGEFAIDSACRSPENPCCHRFAMSRPELSIRHVARLARLELEPGEAEAMQDQLDKVLAHIDKLRELDLGTAAADAQVFNVEQHFEKLFAIYERIVSERSTR